MTCCRFSCLGQRCRCFVKTWFAKRRPAREVFSEETSRARTYVRNWRKGRLNDDKTSQTSCHPCAGNVLVSLGQADASTGIWPRLVQEAVTWDCFRPHDLPSQWNSFPAQVDCLVNYSPTGRAVRNPYCAASASRSRLCDLRLPATGAGEKFENLTVSHSSDGFYRGSPLSPRANGHIPLVHQEHLMPPFKHR